MKNVIFILFVVAFSNMAVAQTAKKGNKTEQKIKKVKEEPMKIVFQVASDDTLVHKSIMRQLGNITSVDSTLVIEVVCHGPGINLIHKDRTNYAQKVKEYTSKGIIFNACEFTLKERQIPKEKILDEAKFVQSALIHIVKKQQEGWSYIKTGF
jgi:uncharacterized protein